MSPLEPFLKDKARHESPLYPVPAPVPTAGTPPKRNPSFVHLRFVGISPPGGIPDFGRFIGSRGRYILVAALAENLPHRSRENEFTDGRVFL
jgi:hypothetical protein